MDRGGGCLGYSRWLGHASPNVASDYDLTPAGEQQGLDVMVAAW